jgi:hypothetical protein
MEKIRLGRTGLLVTKIGFGGIPIQKVDEASAVGVVKRALDLGVNFFDTANAYTTSEGRIGQAIAGRRRESLVLATKTGARTPDDVKAHLKLSLQRLGVDYIDLYQFHNVSDQASLDAILAPGGPLSVAEEAKKAGMVRHIGVTSHQIDFAKDMVKSDRFETIMFPFNFVTSEAADELLPLAKAHDVGFIAMKPLAGGMLDNAALAFKYLFQFPDVVTIPGIEKVSEIDEIIALAEGTRTLSPAEENEMERFRKELGHNFCHRCNYCQPCISDIPISNVLISKSLFKRQGPALFFASRRGMDDAMDKAATCTECGECEERCPYHLPIREMLAEHVKWYREEKGKYQEALAPQ